MMDRVFREAAAVWLAEARGERPARWTLPLVPVALVVSWVLGRRGERFDRGDGVIRPALPVLSVGNLTVGGTNKTPTVDWLVTALGSRRRVGVVTRGYGRSGPARTFRLADAHGSAANGTHAAEDVGDEPWLLARHHPDAWIAIDADRVRGVASLAAQGAELAIADDGFQHRRLGRTFDLVLVDVTCPWGNGRLLPAGILREDLAGLWRADAVVLTRTHELPESATNAVRDVVRRWVPPERIHSARLELHGWDCLSPGPEGARSVAGGELLGRPRGRAFVVTGIARPESLVRTVRADEVEVCGTRLFRDHARIDPVQFREVGEAARLAGADFLVCSEKDLPNLPAGAREVLPIWYPRVGMWIDRAEELLGRITQALDEWDASPNSPGAE